MTSLISWIAVKFQLALLVNGGRSRIYNSTVQYSTAFSVHICPSTQNKGIAA